MYAYSLSLKRRLSKEFYDRVRESRLVNCSFFIFFFTYRFFTYLLSNFTYLRTSFMAANTFLFDNDRTNFKHGASPCGKMLNFTCRLCHSPRQLGS